MTAGLKQTWVISGAALRSMLERAHEGEDPGLVMLEEYVNCEIEPPPEGDDD